MSDTRHTTDPLYSEYADDPIIGDLISGFVAELPNRLRAMREALAEGRLDELRILAHRLKGAGGGYGFPSLTTASARLEEACRQTEPQTASMLLDELTELVGRICAGAGRPVS